MKHIFIVHSHITYLSALGVVMTEKIAPTEVLILSESYNFPDAPIPICQTKKLAITGKFVFTPYKRMDKIIKESIGEAPFIAYIPVFHYMGKYLMTHPQCTKFNFTEEGFAAYYDFFSYKLYSAYAIGPFRFSRGLSGLKQRLRPVLNAIKGHTPKIEAIPTFYGAYAADPNVTFYGFHELSYYLTADKVVVNLRDVFTHYRMKAKHNLTGSHIWIGNPDILSKCNIAVEEYIEAIRSGCVPKLRSEGVTKISIKHHYRELPRQRKLITEMFFNEGFEVEELSDDTILELELANATNCKLYGVMSSLQVYGVILGHESFSIANHIKNYSIYFLNAKNISSLIQFL